jgi:hypothetical protein
VPRSAFSADGIDFKSLWSRWRFAPWTDVEGLFWRQNMKWLDLRIHGGGVMHFSPFVQGLDGFARMALERLPPAVLRSSPTGKAVLLLVARNECTSLVARATSPETLLAELPRS